MQICKKKFHVFNFNVPLHRSCTKGLIVWNDMFFPICLPFNHWWRKNGRKTYETSQLLHFITIGFIISVQPKLWLYFFKVIKFYTTQVSLWTENPMFMLTFENEEAWVPLIHGGLNNGGKVDMHIINFIWQWTWNFNISKFLMLSHGLHITKYWQIL